VITERPDLFAAASIGVGNLDQIRSETRANGAGNIPEYGTVNVEAEFTRCAATALRTHQARDRYPRCCSSMV